MTGGAVTVTLPYWRPSARQSIRRCCEYIWWDSKANHGGAGFWGSFVDSRGERHDLIIGAKLSAHIVKIGDKYCSLYD
jgi:hypothetical protein